MDHMLVVKDEAPDSEFFVLKLFKRMKKDVFILVFHQT